MTFCILSIRATGISAATRRSVPIGSGLNPCQTANKAASLPIARGKQRSDARDIDQKAAITPTQSEEAYWPHRRGDHPAPSEMGRVFPTEPENTCAPAMGKSRSSFMMALTCPFLRMVLSASQHDQWLGARES